MSSKIAFYRFCNSRVQIGIEICNRLQTHLEFEHIIKTPMFTHFG